MKTGITVKCFDFLYNPKILLSKVLMSNIRIRTLGHIEPMLVAAAKKPARGISIVAGRNRQQPSCRLEEALNAIENHQVVDVIPSYASLLRSCGDRKALSDVKHVHSHISANGLGQDRFLSNLVVQVYASCGSLEAARNVFDGIPRKNSFSWNIMISAYTRAGHATEALDLYRRLLDCQGFEEPGAFVYASVLGACSTLRELAEGKLVHARIVAAGLEDDVVVATALVKMYANCGCLELARGVFDRMPGRDSVSWTAMITAYAQRGHPREAFHVYHRMELEGVQPDGFTFSCILGVCSAIGELSEAKKIHLQVIAAGCHSHTVVQNALLNVYAKCGCAVEARKVFEGMQWRDVVSWTSMISAYNQQGHCKKALELYHRMESEGGIKPDSGIFVSILAACSSLGILEHGKEIHARIVALGLQSNNAVQSSLISMYTNCGSLQDAKLVFDEMGEKDVVCWTAMVAGYAQHGHSREALALYKEMEYGAVEPNEVTFGSVIAACSTLGAVQEAKAVHAQAAARGLDSNPAVQIGLVNMYAKCGSLGDATEVFQKIQGRTVVSWTAMAAAYAQHGHYKEAVELSQEMEAEGIEPDDINHIITLIACSHGGLLEFGREYFLSMRADRGMEPTIEHYVCMIDLLGRAGRLSDAEELLWNMPFEADAVAWTVLLGACRMHSDAKRGGRAAEVVSRLDPVDTAPYILLSNIYAAGT